MGEIILVSSSSLQIERIFFIDNDSHIYLLNYELFFDTGYDALDFVSDKVTLAVSSVNTRSLGTGKKYLMIFILPKGSSVYFIF